MLEHVLAIDVSERLSQFVDETNRYAKKITAVKNVRDIFAAGPNTHSIDGIFVSIYETLPKELLEQLPSLRFIFVLGTSTKLVPVDYCNERGIKIFAIYEYCDEETAEWVMLKILEHFREKEHPKSVFEKKLGVIGVGGVGRGVIKRAHAFSMKIFYNGTTHHRDLDEMGINEKTKEEIFKECDVVTFHTPPQTLWLTDDILKAARKDLLMINTCMGRISVGDSLEKFLSLNLHARLIMDKIAAASYETLAERATIFPEHAYLTVDSQRRLQEKFWANVRGAV